VVEGERPVTLKLCAEPAGCGAGSPVAWVAEAQLSGVMAEVEYLMSYWEAVPIPASSPVAVQASLIEAVVGLPVARSLTAAGGTLSGVGVGVGIGVRIYSAFISAGFRVRL
jgi:hypothetical protein